MGWLVGLVGLARDVFAYVTKSRKVELPPEPKPINDRVLVEIEEARRRRAERR